tara:strand:- start:120 stop:926 length:807 start_codon:yes stop_codon:yes gene_type:complete
MEGGFGETKGKNMHFETVPQSQIVKLNKHKKVALNRVGVIDNAYKKWIGLAVIIVFICFLIQQYSTTKEEKYSTAKSDSEQLDNDQLITLYYQSFQLLKTDMKEAFSILNTLINSKNLPEPIKDDVLINLAVLYKNGIQGFLEQNSTKANEYLVQVTNHPVKDYKEALDEKGKGNLESALEKLKVPVNKKYIPALYEAGVLNFELGEYRNAETLWSEIIEEEEHPQALHNLAYLTRFVHEDISTARVLRKRAERAEIAQKRSPADNRL